MPLERARDIAKQYNVYHLISELLEYIPGDIEPPPAPKHNTNQANKPRAIARVPAPKKPSSKSRILFSDKSSADQRVAPVPLPRQHYEETYENYGTQLHEEDTPENSSMISESVIGEEESMYGDHYSNPRKRKRGQDHAAMNEKAHIRWSDALLDFFMLRRSDDPDDIHRPPSPPFPFQPDRSVDHEGHTALHWAAAMGDLNIIRDLIRRGASIDSRNIRGETPLIRAALFANCHEKNTWTEIVNLLCNTIDTTDSHGGSILHHVAHTAHSGARTHRARHYLDVLLKVYSDHADPAKFSAFVNLQDRQGDTAFHIAARNSKRCMKAFQMYGVASNIQNHAGETVDMYLADRADSVKKSGHVFSSSPIAASQPNGNEIDLHKSSQNLSLTASSFQAPSSVSFSESFGSTIVPQVHGFLQAGEEEYQEKISHLADAENLLHKAKMDLQSVKQQIQNLDDSMETNDLSALQAELDAEVKLAQGFEERKQHRAIHQLVRENEEKVKSRSNGVCDGVDLGQTLAIARELLWEQQKRRKLTEEVVQSQADEGMTPCGDLCKQLIAKVLNVPEQDVLGIVPEMLENLEMDRNSTSTA